MEKTIEFIESRRDTGEPWLISGNPFDPHPPRDPPQEYKDRLNSGDMPRPLWEEGEREGKPPHQQKDVIQGGQDGKAEPIGTLTEAGAYPRCSACPYIPGAGPAGEDVYKRQR